MAWVKSSSAKKAGAAQFVASIGDNSVRRVVQQVASEPCNLRMHISQKTQDHIVLETEPIRDCTGNPVPDGTIVTFIENDKTGKSVVDARIKKGIARARVAGLRERERHHRRRRRVWQRRNPHWRRKITMEPKLMRSLVLGLGIFFALSGAAPLLKRILPDAQTSFHADQI